MMGAVGQFWKATLFRDVPLRRLPRCCGEGIETHLQFVTYRSRLPENRVMGLYRERVGRYQAAPGLVEKHYVHNAATRRYGGVHLWETREAMAAYWTPERLQDLKDVYAVEGEPRIEDFAVVDAIGGKGEPVRTA